jgi:ATP-binding cassette subfamily B protein
MNKHDLPHTLPAFIWRFVKANIKKYSLANAFILFSAVAPSIDGYILKIIIDSFNALNEKLSPLFSPLALIGIYFLWNGIENLCWRASSFFLYSANADLKASIIKEMSSHLLFNGNSKTGPDSSGSVSHRISEMATNVEQMILLISESILYTSCLILFSGMTLAAIHPWIALLLVAWFSLYVVGSYFLQQHIEKKSKQCTTQRMVALDRLADCIANNPCIKFFSRQSYESQTLNHFLKNSAAEEKSLQRFSFCVRFFQDIVWVSFTASVIGLLFKLQKNAAITIGDCALVLTLSQTIVSYSSSFTFDLSRFAQLIGACSESLSLISATFTPLRPTGSNELTIIDGSIEVSRITFGYDPKKPILKNQSLKIIGGEKIGLVGPSGSGKTTFVNLVARLFDPQHGHIFIDGQDVSTVTEESLRNAISVVPQSPFLFHRSIKENIAYGKLNATDEEIIKAAKKAEAHAFITKLPFGYETIIGEHDISLSHGQAQRIIIARIFIRNTPIIILDEATAALDGITEFRIQKTLDSFTKGKTTIVIVHKFSTLTQMDRILVFENGSIIEDGNHADLIEKNNSLYTKLLQDQLPIAKKQTPTLQP